MASSKFENPWKNQKKRLPSISVSAMNCLTQGFNFVVSINAFTYGFQEVSNISIEVPCEFIPEGGVNDHKLLVGRPEDNEKTLTFKRGLVMRSPAIVSDAAKAAAARIPNNIARRTALVAISALSPQESLETGPSIGVIQVYNRTGDLTGLYNFISLGLKDWKIGDLSAVDGSVLLEEITIYHTGLKRMPVTGVPALFAPTSYSGAESAWDADAAAKRWEEAQKNKEKAAEERKNMLREAEEAKEKAKEMVNSQINSFLNESKEVLGDDFPKLEAEVKKLTSESITAEKKLKALKEKRNLLENEINRLERRMGGGSNQHSSENDNLNNESSANNTNVSNNSEVQENSKMTDAQRRRKEAEERRRLAEEAKNRDRAAREAAMAERNSENEAAQRTRSTEENIENTDNGQNDGLI